MRASPADFKDRTIKTCIENMKVKSCTIILLLLASVVCGLATIEKLFNGWEYVMKSPDILIVQCTKTPDPLYDTSVRAGDGLVISQVEIESVLKGTTNSTMTTEGRVSRSERLVSDFVPRQGEHYLIFAQYFQGNYQAAESYRIVPLGINFSTNMLAGESLDDKIQTLFKYRLSHLDQELKQMQEERKRLEEGIR
jgi:hypothetical protein